MNDEEARKQKRRIQKFITKWQAPMGLRWFKIHLIYERGLCTTGSGTAAETSMANWKYRSFEIIFYLPVIAEQKDDEVEEIVVHELTHCLLGPISCNMRGTNENDDYRRDIMELNTELVASAIMWTYQAGADAAKLELKKVKSDNIKSESKLKEKKHV